MTSNPAETVRTAAGPVEYAAEGEGPVVLLPHGTPGGWDQGIALGRFLVEAGFRVVAPARPGYQGTPLAGRERIDDQADLHAALLDSLDVESAHVFAWSGGGPSAYRLAVRHPDRVRTLVTASAVATTFTADSAMSEKLMMNTRAGNWVMRMLSAHAPKATVQALLKAEGDISKDELKALTDEAMADERERAVVLAVADAAADHVHRGEGIENDYEQFASIDSLELDRVVAPALVLGAELDRDVAPEHPQLAARTIPHAQNHVVPRGTHLAVWVHPDAADTQRRIIDFFRAAPG
jgi:pimeloyl-ACP methyl ester carboxylesterase